MKNWLLAAVIAAGLTMMGGQAGDETASQLPPEKLLFGFEPAEIERFAQALQATITEARDAQDAPYLQVRMGRGRIVRQWCLYRGKATQGQYAAALGLVRWPDRPMPGLFAQKRTAPFEKQSLVMHYFGMFADGDWTRMFNSAGIHHLFLPSDWSQYDLLRLDVYSKGMTLEYRLAVEDEDILPPVVRVMQVPADRWTTLELDLQAAREQRGLDPTKIVSLALAVCNIVEGEMPQTKDPKARRELRVALVDNIRLCRRDVPAKFPVLRDPSSYRLPPDYYGPVSEPRPRTVEPHRPDHSPLKLQEPMIIRTGERTHTVARMGWISAYDNNHMSIGFEVAQFWGSRVLQTMDGGKSWVGLDGKSTPTPLNVMDFIDGGGTGDVIDRFGDVVITVFGLGCGGPGTYHPRVFTKQLSFQGAGKGWALRELRALADCEPRHCTATQSAFRAANGRIWLAYGVLNRLNRTCIHVRYSDDDGFSWFPLELGQVGRIPGSLWPPEGRLPGDDFGTYVKTDPDPRLVPLGKGFACLWHNRRARWDQPVPLYMARYDGQQWLPLETVPYTPEKTEFHSLPRLQAVSIGGKELFVQTAYANGVLHYKDGRWAGQLPEAPASLCRLCVAGENTVVLVAAIPQPGGTSRGNTRLTAPVVFRVWEYKGDGVWTAPQDVARENEPLPIGDTWSGFQVPRISPPNFVPLAWANGGDWIKVLRVPVGKHDGEEAAEQAERSKPKPGEP